MKSLLLTLVFTLLLINCTNKKTDESIAATNKPVQINQVVGIGRIEPENQLIQLSAEVAGIVHKVYKNENDSVQAGNLIFELKHSVEDANINQLKEAVAVQNAQIKTDEKAVKESQVRFNNANINVQRLQNLLAKGAETRQVVENATTEMQSFQANIKKLKAEVEVSKLKWAESKTQVSTAKVQLQQKFIKAPISGILLELNIQPGNYINSSQIFGQLKPEGKTIAVCEIDELFADKIKIGQIAIIRNFGSSETLSTGKVNFTSSFLKKKSLFTDQAGEKEDRRVREIKILLDHPGSILLNSRVECVINLKK